MKINGIFKLGTQDLLAGSPHVAIELPDNRPEIHQLGNTSTCRLIVVQTSERTLCEAFKCEIGFNLKLFYLIIFQWLRLAVPDQGVCLNPFKYHFKTSTNNEIFRKKNLFEIFADFIIQLMSLLFAIEKLFNLLCSVALY